MNTIPNELFDAERSISMEAELLGIGRAATEFADKLRGYLSGVKKYIVGVFTPLENARIINFKQDHGIRKKLEATNYVNMTDITVFIPPGLTATWVDYLDILEDSQDLADTILTEVLRPAIVYFSQLLGTPESLASINPISAAQTIGNREEKITAVRKRISESFNPGKTLDRGKYGQYFRRHAEWGEVNNRVGDLVEKITVTNPRTVSASVSELTRLMDTLIIRMKQNPEHYSLSGVKAADLAKIAMNLGKEVEFFAGHFYLIQQAAAAMDETVKRFRTIL